MIVETDSVEVVEGAIGIDAEQKTSDVAAVRHEDYASRKRAHEILEVLERRAQEHAVEFVATLG